MKILISLLLLIVIFSSCQKAPGPVSEFPWKPYSQQAIIDSIAHNKPVVIDFFADWCPNCHDLDRVVYSRPDVQAKLSQLTTLRVDATDQEDPKVQKILGDYDIEGLPTVVFLNGKGKEIDNSRVIGFVTPEEFLQALALVKVLK